MKMTAKCLIARIFPAPKPYAVAILAASAPRTAGTSA